MSNLTPYHTTPLGTLYHGDCLSLMPLLEGKVDMILCDLPYGTTACKWDTVIPFEPLWEQYKRLIKPNGAIVLTASQPFTSALVMSNVGMFKYQWVWDKSLPTGFQNANVMPLKQHEDVIVFGTGKLIYNPQKEPREKPRKYNRGKCSVGGETLGEVKHDGQDRILTDYCPRSILKVQNADNARKFHPTQKPVALFEYLIKTYTNEGDTVLDNCMGSGTTAVACENLNRKWIGIEREEKYCQTIVSRL